MTGRVETLPSDRALDERFERHVLVADADGCWLWTGGVRGDGSGAFATPLRAPGRPAWLPKDRRQVGAHQYALARAEGAWPREKVWRTCGTPLCVRPDHHYVATQEEGARAWARAYGKTQLTAEDVRDLRAGRVTPHAVARLRGVQVQAARHARDGVTWKWLDAA